MDQRAPQFWQPRQLAPAPAPQHFAAQTAQQANSSYNRPAQFGDDGSRQGGNAVLRPQPSGQAPVTGQAQRRWPASDAALHLAEQRALAPMQRPLAPAPTREELAAQEEQAALARAQQQEAALARAQQEEFQNQHISDDNEDDDGNMEPIYQLPPPPEHIYANDRECDQAMHAWSLEHGYELVRRASKKDKQGRLYKRYYHCSKHGKLANTGKLTEETRIRLNRKSNRIGCPMSLATIALDPSDPDGPWEIRHRKVHHNHGPLEGVALAGHRRRARVGGVEKAVDGLFAIGTSTAQVHEFLQRTNPNGLFTRTDVANMKLKYKKYGTCAGAKASTAGDRHGVPSACLSCRSKKMKCDSNRPSCASCTEANTSCQYDHEPNGENSELQQDVSTLSNNTMANDGVADSPQTPAAENSAAPQQSVRRQQDILADLQAFQAAHIQQTKLSLSSSVVEVLAASTCGNGDSYRSVRPLEHAGQWKTFYDAMLEASMKENTYDVLTGQKGEPDRPGQDHSVDEWNEYIKMLAIFNRRNTALMGALLPRISHIFKPRLANLTKATDVMTTLEDACQPRGADEAIRMWAGLHSITLHNSSSLQDFIIRLENAYANLNRMKLPKPIGSGGGAKSTNSRRESVFDPWKSTTSDANRRLLLLDMKDESGNMKRVIYPEWMLCFHFLSNLGPQYEQWVQHLCMTNNVGGFGTGRSIEFADVTRLALEQEKLNRKHAQAQVAASEH